jgi:diadenosine tetraphosphate (Ap4A) HIT family hydrolase
LANCGEAAAQTITHAHIHVIPRFPEDRPVLVYEVKLREMQTNQ